MSKIITLYWRRIQFGIFYLCLGSVGGFLGGWGMNWYVQNTSQPIDAIVEVCKITAYSALDDGLRPGDKGFNKLFTGDKPIVDYTIAIDPKYWAKKFSISYNPETKYSERALSPVFWQLIFLIEDQYEKLHAMVPRDIGGKVLGNQLDCYKGYDERARQEALKFGKQFRKVYVIKKEK